MGSTVAPRSRASSCAGAIGSGAATEGAEVTVIGHVRPESSIQIGEHTEGHLGGWTFNLDTIWTTVIAGAIVVALGFWARNQLTKDTEDHVPTKLQIMWE